jgi:hypothetical protein
MTSTEDRLAAIFKQYPDLNGLEYAVQQTALAVAVRRLPGTGPDTFADDKRYTYTFKAPTEGTRHIEIKVTINGAGDILKIVTSK